MRYSSALRSVWLRLHGCVSEVLPLQQRLLAAAADPAVHPCEQEAEDPSDLARLRWGAGIFLDALLNEATALVNSPDLGVKRTRPVCNELVTSCVSPRKSAAPFRSTCLGSASGRPTMRNRARM